MIKDVVIRTEAFAETTPANSGRIVGYPSMGPISSRCRLDSDLVIYGCGDTLRAAEVALSRLDRHMAEEKLNLLQFTSGRPT